MLILALRPVISLWGSGGWELFYLVLVAPLGMIAGILMIVGGRRFDRAPGSATLCFALAAVLGIFAADTGGFLLPFDRAFPLSLIIALIPVMLAALSCHAYLRGRRNPANS
jgi:hypothetical protein